MSKSEKQLRKQLIKQRFLRALHIICYILSTLFIIICIIAGVKSCSSSNDKKEAPLQIKQPLNALPSNFDYSNSNIYKLKDFTFDAQFLNDVNEVFGYPTFNVNDYDIGDIFITDYNPSVPFKALDVTTSELIDFSFIRYEFIIQADSNGYMYFRFNSAIFNFNEQYAGRILRKASALADDSSYYIGDYRIVFFDNSFNDFLTPSYNAFFFEQINSSSFIFNQNFNYNAPLNSTTASVYYQRPFDIQGEGVYYYYLYDTGFFVSNNEIFNQIRWTSVATLGSARFQFPNGDIKAGPEGSENVFYFEILYVNTLTNKSVQVNQRDQVAYMPTSSSYGYYWVSSTTWILDSYRYITFLTDINQSTLDTIKKFNNNYQNYFGGGGNITGVSNVFDLLALAFTSLSDFWSINLLPGISIGTLFFLPLVVAIVLTVFYFVKR